MLIATTVSSVVEILLVSTSALSDCARRLNDSVDAEDCNVDAVPSCAIAVTFNLSSPLWP